MAADRRKQIVEAAAKSFALFGYKATTMDQVAKIANVGKGTIYTFFTNKEELFDEIVGNLITEVLAIADREIVQGKPFFENLHRVVYAILDFRQNHVLTRQLAHEISEVGTTAAQEAISKIEQAVLSYVKVKVQEGMDAGELKKGDPEMTAFVIFKLYFAFVLDWPRTHAELDKEQISRLFRLYLQEGLAVE